MAVDCDGTTQCVTERRHLLLCGAGRTYRRRLGRWRNVRRDAPSHGRDEVRSRYGLRAEHSAGSQRSQVSAMVCMVRNRERR